MKIVPASFEILDHLDQKSLAVRIEECGRICYKSEDRITPESALPFVENVIERGHNSVLEMGVVTLDICDLNSSMEEFFLCQPKYLHISRDRCRLLVTASIRAWREMLINHPDCEIVRAACALLSERHPYFFSTILPQGGFTANVCIDVCKMPLEDVERLPADKLAKHRHVAVKFKHNRAFCYDSSTEVLTKDGWKLFSAVSDSDSFFTVTNSGNAVYEKPTKIISQQYDGDMICGKSAMVDFCVTPEHRMYWYHYDSRKKGWKISEAREIYGKRVKFQRGMPCEWKGNTIIEDHPQQSDLNFAKFMGIFITDGSLNKRRDNGGKILLSQIKEFGRDYIRSILDALGWAYSEKRWGFEICNSKLHSFMRSHFPETEKRRKMVCRVPMWIKQANREYISCFMEAVIVGDGSIHKGDGHTVVYTANYDLAGDYQECFLKTGKCSTVRMIDRIGTEHLIAGKMAKKINLEYIVSVTNKNNEHLFSKKHWSRKDYSGDIFCVTIPSGLLYVRRNGKAFWSGNSHEVVRHRPCSFLQESQRYCRYSDLSKFGGDVTFIKPMFWAEDSEDCRLWARAMQEAEEIYMRLLGRGSAPQAARTVLPNSCKTEIIVHANLEQWQHIFKLRCSKAAEPSMQEVMVPLREEFARRWPEVLENV